MDGDWSSSTTPEANVHFRIHGHTISLVAEMAVRERHRPCVHITMRLRDTRKGAVVKRFRLGRVTTALRAFVATLPHAPVVRGTVEIGDRFPIMDAIASSADAAAPAGANGGSTYIDDYRTDPSVTLCVILSLPIILVVGT